MFVDEIQAPRASLRSGESRLFRRVPRSGETPKSRRTSPV